MTNSNESMFKLMLLILIKCNIFSWNYRMYFPVSAVHFHFIEECFLCFLRQFDLQFWEKFYSTFPIFQSFNSTTFMPAYSCWFCVCVFLCVYFCASQLQEEAITALTTRPLLSLSQLTEVNGFKQKYLQALK